MWILFALAFLVVLFIWMRKKPKNATTISPSHPNYLEIQQELINMLPPSYEVPNVSLKKFSQNSFEYIEQIPDSLVNYLKSFRFLGIDIEEFRQSSYIGSVCLIQISTPEKTLVVDALKAKSEILKLAEVFLDPEITKVFHGCFNDLQWLQRDFSIVCVNVFDTQIAARQLKMPKLGLNSLWERFCEFSMSAEAKKKMQVSNWQQRPLTSDQVEYSAMDSHYLVFLMKVMIQELNEKDLQKIRKETNKICLERYTLRLNSDYCLSLFKENFPDAQNSGLCRTFTKLLKLLEIVSNSQKILLSDLAPLPKIIQLLESKTYDLETIKKLLPNPVLSDFYTEIQQILENPSFSSKSSDKSLLGTELKKQQKQERYQNFLKKYTIPGKVFENCQIQLPNGEILCYANAKKARWYLDRSLATIITQEPLVVRLNFEPSFKSEVDERDRKFFKKEKKNECVVCGSAESFLRYRVVPLLYRQYFPEDFKNYCRHDVLLLCANCHELCNKQAEALKRKIAQDFQVPLFSFSPAKQFKEKVQAIRKICISLKKNSKKIPESRKEELLNQVQDFVSGNCQGFEEFQGKNIEEIAEMLLEEKVFQGILESFEKVDWKNEEINNHGRLVMEKVKDVKEFVYVWKKAFVCSMRPKFLPESWIEDKNLEIYSN